MRPGSLPVVATALLVALALTSPAAAQGRKPPDDERVRKAWSFLLPEEQEEAIAWYTAEVDALDSFQMRLVRHALGLLEADPGFLEEDGPIPYFEPEEHAPGQPIPRVRLDEDDRRASRVRADLMTKVPERELRSQWRYDWGRREIVRRGAFQDIELTFENGLAGFPPRADLAEAAVLAALDRGPQQAALAAFGHAYTDRTGNVYPGLTLYDAWASGLEIEMPDVDNLGIFHSLGGERGRFRAPIPESRQDELYAIVGGHYEAAHRYRALRTALAQVYLVGDTPLRDGYEFHWLRLHGIWNQHDSSPAALSPLLPQGDDAADWFAEWTLDFEEDGARRSQAKARAKKLDGNRRLVRARLVNVLEQMGAFERRRKPKPKPKPKPDKKSKR